VRPIPKHSSLVDADPDEVLPLSSSSSISIHKSPFEVLTPMGVSSGRFLDEDEPAGLGVLVVRNGCFRF
jgi:hypothetical protein